MTNELAPKAASKLLRGAFENKGVKVTHTEALDLLAQLKGYNSWSHQSQASKLAKPVKKPGATKSSKPPKELKILRLASVLQSHYPHDGECPAHPRSDWESQVENGETSSGYWEWLPSEALGRDTEETLETAYSVPRPIEVTTPNGDATTWDIELNLTDRWGDLNWYCSGSKPGLAILQLDAPLLESLQSQMAEEITFISRKDNEFGLLFEVEYCSRESESSHDPDNESLKPHADIKETLLKGLRALENKFPMVQFAYPAEKHIVNDRPAVWGFVKNGALTTAQARELASEMLDL